MATSSIFTTVKITNPQKAEMFFSALNSSIQQQQTPQRSPAVHVTSTREDIAALMSKRKKND